jgi:hypothetical protein
LPCSVCSSSECGSDAASAPSRYLAPPHAAGCREHATTRHTTACQAACTTSAAANTTMLAFARLSVALPSGARQCLLEMLGVGVARLCVVEREHEQRRIDPLKRPRVLQRARMRRCGCMKCVLRVFCGVPAAKALQTPRAAPPKCCGLGQSSLRGTALRMRRDNMQYVAHARCDTTQRHV